MRIKIYADNKDDNLKVWKWLTTDCPKEGFLFDAYMGKTTITVNNIEEPLGLWKYLNKNVIDEVAEMEIA